MRNQKGFTLVELLVVVGIIAILALVGITVYSNTLKSSRDTKRRADIQAIAKALEAHYDTLNARYPALDNSWFQNPDGSGTKPSDPLSGDATGCNGNPCIYCFKASGACIATDPTVNTVGSSFRVCANLEATNVNTSGTYCINSLQ